MNPNKSLPWLTAGHELLTPKGWRGIDTIGVGSEVLAYKQGEFTEFKRVERVCSERAPLLSIVDEVVDLEVSKYSRLQSKAADGEPMEYQAVKWKPTKGETWYQLPPSSYGSDGPKERLEQGDTLLALKALTAVSGDTKVIDNIAHWELTACVEVVGVVQKLAISAGQTADITVQVFGDPEESTIIVRSDPSLKMGLPFRKWYKFPNHDLRTLMFGFGLARNLGLVTPEESVEDLGSMLMVLTLLGETITPDEDVYIYRPKALIEPKPVFQVVPAEYPGLVLRRNNRVFVVGGVGID